MVTLDKLLNLYNPQFFGRVVHATWFVTSCCCSIAKSCLTPCDPVDCSTSGFPVLHYLPGFEQTHVQWIDNVILPSHPLLPPPPPAFNLSQHQGLFQWVGFYASGGQNIGASALASVSSVTQLCLTLCDPMDCSTPGLPVHHQLPDLGQTHVHRVSDAIQPSHPLSSPSPPTFNLSQHQGLFQRVSSSIQVAKVLELQL